MFERFSGPADEITPILEALTRTFGEQPHEAEETRIPRETGHMDISERTPYDIVRLYLFEDEGYRLDVRVGIAGTRVDGIPWKSMFIRLEKPA